MQKIKLMRRGLKYMYMHMAHNNLEYWRPILTANDRVEFEKINSKYSIFMQQTISVLLNNNITANSYLSKFAKCLLYSPDFVAQKCYCLLWVAMTTSTQSLFDR